MTCRFFEDFKGYLHADGYSNYLPLLATTRVKIVACLASIRRKFYAITKTVNTEGLAHQAMKWITPLYYPEKRLRDDNASFDIIKATRLEKAVPMLNDTHDCTG